MPIKLPTINDAHFQGMSACGHLESEPEVLDKLLDGSRHDFIATLTLGSERMILALLVGDRPNKHIHIDLVKETVYGMREGQPRVVADEIQARLSPLMGEPIAVGFFGRYRIPAGSLPESGLIDILKFNVNIDAITFAVTGSELSITGAPINKLSWRTKDDYVVVDLEGEINTIINEEYMISIYDILSKTFEGLVLPGGNHGGM